MKIEHLIIEWLLGEGWIEVQSSDALGGGAVSGHSSTVWWRGVRNGLVVLVSLNRRYSYWNGEPLPMRSYKCVDGDMDRLEGPFYFDVGDPSFLDVFGGLGS